MTVGAYVLAITDGPLPKRMRTTRSLHEIVVGGIHAVYERRQHLPDITDKMLRAQHKTVIEIARHGGAILPARFGALLAKQELRSLLRSHRDELRRALDDVRDRVQMTTRVLGSVPERGPATATSGRAYLEERRRISRPALPAAVEAFLAAVRPLAVRERREPGAGGLVAAFYHLVNVADLPDFEQRVSEMAADNLIVTGPWPPFAFTPPLI